MSGGALGYLPDWYSIIHAARVINQAPWVLAGCPFEPDKVPVFWTQWALQYELAQSEIDQEQHKARQRTDAAKSQGIGGTH